MTRKEAVDILKSYLMFDKSNMQINIALNMAIEALQDNTAVTMINELAEVVRCKDCEYADFNSPYPVCNFLEMNICENGYCSWARMKDGAE